jgi:hypothetical protein
LLVNIRLCGADVNATRGDYLPAVEEAEAAAQREDLKALSSYIVGCVYSQSASAAGKDPKLSPVKRAELKERYEAKAMEFLRQAVAKGHRNLAAFRADRDLDPLRGRDDFKKLVGKLEEQARAGSPKH